MARSASKNATTNCSFADIIAAACDYFVFRSADSLPILLVFFFLFVLKGLRRSVKTLSKAGQESDGFEEEVAISMHAFRTTL